MIKSKATQALELLEQFRWIFQEVTNRNAEVVENLQKRVELLEEGIRQMHQVLGEIVNILEKQGETTDEG